MIESDGATTPSPYRARLPIGERLVVPKDGAVSWDIFPYEGEPTGRVLESAVLPEPPRHGEDGAGSCSACAREDASYLWTDENWRLTSVAEAPGIPAMLLLEPRAHVDLAELPAERAAEIGPVLQRVERAVRSLDDVARVHINRWGDGAAHLHLWLLARPAGQVQLRGSLLPLWEEMLPRLPEEEWRENNRRIAAAMAAGGGIAHM
ncbi:hypothetical protein ACGFX4_22465 [Kitasatospora sp. NPDC048365]|uniref:hypothetical protein n=1 Tax=Kitasatospora sp. NPDC048365 TaxID=3364050 RepID=UPI00371B0ED0